jgi:hypothetical protein
MICIVIPSCMIKTYKPVPWQAWIASFVMLFHALAPVWAHAQGPSLVEVCSVGGSKFVAASGTSGDATAALVHALSHCQHCCSQMASPPLPILTGLRFAVPRQLLAITSQRESLPFSRTVFSPDQARAPPFSLS